MSVTEVCNIIFSSLILIISAGITSHIFHGFGTLKWKETFVGLILLIAICIQLYFIIQASCYIPMESNNYNSFIRLDCLSSSKGGKRPQGSFRDFDLNPCFCHIGAECILKSTDVVVSTNGTCPNSPDYKCRNPLNNHEIPRYIPDDRGCKGGQGASCSYENPCDPCDQDELSIWKSGRCRTCSKNNKGECNFIPGKGPYCREKKGSKVVVPCKICCTNSQISIINGTCY